MEIILFGIGFLLAAAVMVDALITTLVPSGGGPVTAFLSEKAWRLVLRLHRPGNPSSHRLLVGAGPMILLLVIVFWVVLLWAGWTLMFSSTLGAVVDSSTSAPVDGWGRVYFAGFTLFTLGIGNYVPGSGFWEVATALASFNGLFLITLSITYLLPVVSAAAQMQQLAALITDIGRGPYQIVEKLWDGHGFGSIDQVATTIAPLLELHTQRHTAYPVVHYFHGGSRRTAIGLAIAALDEAIFFLHAGVAPEVRPRGPLMTMLEEAASGLIGTFQTHYSHPITEPPAVLPLEPLRALGIPVVSDGQFLEAAHERREHRAQLWGFVYDAGWKWSDVAADTLAER